MWYVQLNRANRCSVNTTDKNQRLIPKFECVNPFTTFSKSAHFDNIYPSEAGFTRES